MPAEAGGHGGHASWDWKRRDYFMKFLGGQCSPASAVNVHASYNIKRIPEKNATLRLGRLVKQHFHRLAPRLTFHVAWLRRWDRCGMTGGSTRATSNHRYGSCDLAAKLKNQGYVVNNYLTIKISFWQRPVWRWAIRHFQNWCVGIIQIWWKSLHFFA